MSKYFVLCLLGIAAAQVPPMLHAAAAASVAVEGTMMLSDVRGKLTTTLSKREVYGLKREGGE